MPAKPRTAARKPAVRKTPTSSVLRLDRQENVDKIAAMVADREPLFSIGGVEYSIPKQVPAAWTIKATHLAMTAGDLVAAEYAVGKMLGEDGYKALADCETLTLTDFEIVRDAILDRVLPGEKSGPKS
jgi:hypothetical protein